MTDRRRVMGAGAKPIHLGYSYLYDDATEEYSKGISNKNTGGGGQLFNIYNYRSSLVWSYWKIWIYAPFNDYDNWSPTYLRFGVNDYSATHTAYEGSIRYNPTPFNETFTGMAMNIYRPNTDEGFSWPYSYGKVLIVVERSDSNSFKLTSQAIKEAIE